MPASRRPPITLHWRRNSSFPPPPLSCDLSPREAAGPACPRNHRRGMQITERRRTAATLAVAALAAMTLAGSVGGAKIAGATTTPGRTLFDDFDYPTTE